MRSSKYTEHFDLANPVTKVDDIPDYEMYSQTIDSLNKRFGNRVLKGIEIGYIASEKDRIIDYLADKDFHSSFSGSILFDVGELRQHLFCIKKYRKDTLKSFRINLPNKFIGGFKMSHTQLIKDTLNILDLNIHFEENCLTKEKYKGQICLIYKGTLLYKPEECPHCLCVVPSRIIRWGTTTVRLLLNDVSEYRTYLELKKQRFKCKSCQRTFVADTSVAEKYCFISQKVRWSVIARLKENTSMTEIARQKNISTSSVYRVMKRFYRPLNPFKQTLPKVLCFDEFKSVRHVTSAMSFIMMDGQSHALLDIVENRRLPYLERYFSRFSLATREAVQWIVIDMYAPYVSLVKKLFPNAQLIIDRFHIVQHIGRTFLNHRVKETTARLKGTSHSQRGLGKKLKRYWKLLQKEEAKLNYEKRVWRASFKDYLTESEIVDRLLSACPNLRQGYQLYQDILYAVKKRDQSLFEDCLNREVSGLPETYTTTLRTFKKFLPQIQNALHYSYSNGPLECLNNHIKVLKRNAYGFRSFYNFKLRIMIRHGKTFLTK